ncbi:extracellular calcium-sensing receptor-like [Phyllobates terribilis]|uniref:extracellular calcium-sensing receptor-like n=1 Tax=Phyllobates terribilis TaxID=111132 RepID=UPI003CCB41A3
MEILLFHHMSVIYSMSQMCRLPPMSDQEGIRQPGDIMLGVLLPINSEKIYQKLTFEVRPPKTTCRLFSLEYYHRFQSFLFTVEEINRDPNILPNMTVGFQMYETCDIPHYELQGALQFLTDSSTTISDNQCNSRPMFPAVIGATISPNSIILAHVLGTFRYPQISAFSTISLLSNRRMFPSFFRTSRNDKYQSAGMAQLILRFGWTWIGLLAIDNDYGLLGIQPIKEELIKAGACVAFMEYIRIGQPDRNAPYVVKVMKESTATVVVVFATEIEFIPILNEMLKQNVTGKTFIGNHAWARSLLLSINKYFMTLSGSINLANYDYTVPGLSQFLAKINPSASLTAKWTKMMWEMVFKCQFLPENQTVYLENPEKVCTGSEHIEDIKNTSNYVISLKTTYNMFAAVHILFKALDDLTTCKEGEGPIYNSACAEIRNFRPWQLTYYIRRVRVKMNVESEKYFDENGNAPGLYAIVNWQLKADGTLTQDKIGTYNISAPSPWALTLNTSLILWSSGRKQVPTSSCSENCTMGFRKAVLQGKPSCCYACIPCLQGEISNHTGSLTLSQFILCITWITNDPPFAQYSTDIKPEIIIVDCNEGSPIAFWTMLGYLFLLATISFIVAFLARRLPDSFNEAQFITFSMLAFLSVWISYIPASLSAQGKYTVAMEIFAIQASSWALVICMFLPKCFFILFRPEMNSRENVMRKNKDNTIHIQ